MEVRAFELLVHSIQRLSLARDINGVMSIVREVARQLCGADGATFILKEGDKCYYADEDAIAPLWKGQRFPMESCISGWAMINRKAAVIEDIYADSRIPHEAYRPTFVKSLAMVPIRTLEPIGAIGNYWAKKHNPTGEEVYMLQSLADITSVSMENVYSYLELEKRIKERTNELEEANKTLQTFNYSVSHDLRAPIRVIRGLSQLVLEKDKKLSAQTREEIEEVEKTASSMQDLLEGLLEFSKVGVHALSLQPLDMQKMAGEVAAAAKKSEPGRKIDFDIRGLPSASGDPLLIRQVWVNLISNAVKYTGRKEEAKIEVGGLLHPREVVYFVKDNGDGFDMKYAQKLFGIFQRLHSQEEFRGHGVGLALVEKIVSRHGGRVWAEGKEGEGAVFYFSLPKAVAPSDQEVKV